MEVITLRRTGSRTGSRLYLANRFGGFAGLQEAFLFTSRREAMAMRSRFPAAASLCCVDVTVRQCDGRRIILLGVWE